MIVDRVSIITQQFAERSELEQAKNNQEAIAHTYEALEELARTIGHFAQRFELLKSRFNDEEIDEILNGLRQPHERLKQLHEQFPEANDQRRRLFTLKNTVDETMQLIEDAWKKYASEQVEPHSNLFTLVRNLPEVANDAPRLEMIKRQLEHAIQHMPKTDRELSKFDDHIAAFESTLTDLHGLETELQNFLFKVQIQEATVDDLTPSVLAWCREKQRGSAFKIRLA